MLQDVASHYISELECLKTLRTTALKSPSRNYPKKSKYKFETKFTLMQRCKPERILQDVEHPVKVHQPSCRCEG